jgi:Fe-S-cluster containining protein
MITKKKIDFKKRSNNKISKKLTKNNRISKDMRLSRILKLTPPCSCNACNHGCKFGSGYFIDGQIEKVAEFLKINLEELKNKYLTEEIMLNKKVWRPKRKRERLKMPFGECIFFDSRKELCKIHPVKPLQCQIAMGCKSYGEDLMQWFVINHVLDLNNYDSIREYNIMCNVIINNGGKILKGGSLRELISAKTLKKILSREEE